MLVVADYVRMDERGSLPLPAVLRRVSQRVVRLEEVASVDLGDEEVRKTADELRDRSARRRDFDGNRDRVTVVFDQVEHRELQVAGGVERFPEFPFGDLSVSARDVNELVFVKLAVGLDGRKLRHTHARLREADRVQELH